MDYFEPVHGWESEEKGYEWHPLNLLWLPRNDGEAPSVDTKFIHEAAACFLFDKYRVDHNVAREKFNLQASPAF